MLDVKLDVLEAGIEATKTALRGGVLSIDIWDKGTGLSVIDWNGNPTAVALFNQMTNELDDTLSGSGFPKLKDYYLLDLTEDKSVVIIDHGDDIMQGWLLDTTKTNPGILLGMAIPKAIQGVENAKGGASAPGAAQAAAAAAGGDSSLQLNLILAAGKMALWDMVVDAGDPVSPKNAFTWTPEFRAMLGYSDESDFPNVLDSWSNLLHPDHHDITVAAFAKHLTDRTGQTPYDVEYQLKRKTGEYKWYRATGETTRDENGVPLRVVGVLTDIDDLRQKSGATNWVNHDPRA